VVALNYIVELIVLKKMILFILLLQWSIKLYGWNILLTNLKEVHKVFLFLIIG